LATTAEPNWRIGMGYEWVALRDIARSGRPVDASPVAWRGDGIGVEAEHSRTRGTRLHRYIISAAFDGHFVYRSPLGSSGRPADDRYLSLDGSYEYRRYPFTDVVVRGLDAGVGVQAIAVLAAFTRHVPVDLTTTRRLFGGGPALVAAARLHRWSRVTGELVWINGGELLRYWDRDGETTSSAPPHWGGGWVSNLTASVTVRLGRQASLALTWAQSKDGRLATHQSWAASHGSVMAGVSYAR
jgi:hypothetical protein